MQHACKSPSAATIAHVKCCSTAASSCNHPKHTFCHQPRIRVSHCALCCIQGVTVSLFSVTNCLGRMSTAFLPERLANGRVIPRTHFLVLGCLATAATSMLDAVSTLDMMPYTSLATGAQTVFLLARARKRYSRRRC